MFIKTKNRTINLVLKTRKIVDIANLLKNKNFEKAFTEAYTMNDPEALAQIILKLAENENGESAFNTQDEVYDFIDECRASKMTVNDIYAKVAEALNEEGFFSKKMTKEELAGMTSNPLSALNLTELVKKSTENAMSQVVTQEIQNNGFQGYRA